jgi:hypothetical protein
MTPFISEAISKKRRIPEGGMLWMVGDMRPDQFIVIMVTPAFFGIKYK